MLPAKRGINVHVHNTFGGRNALSIPARSALPDTPLRVPRHAPREKWQPKGDKIAQWKSQRLLAYDSNTRLNFVHVFEIA